MVIITIIIAVAIIIMNHEVDGNEYVKKREKRLDYKQNNNTAGASHIFVYISSTSIARLGDKTSWWDVL